MDDRLTGGQACRDQYCGKPLHLIGESLYCNNEHCERFAVPVNLDGYTEDEAQQADGSKDLRLTPEIA